MQPQPHPHPLAVKRVGESSATAPKTAQRSRQRTPEFRPERAEQVVAVLN